MKLPLTPDVAATSGEALIRGVKDAAEEFVAADEGEVVDINFRFLLRSFRTAEDAKKQGQVGQ